MKQIREDLWQSKLYKPMPFLKTQSYFLKTENGNVFIYNTGHNAEFDEIESLGGINTQYLSHRHESGKNLKAIKDRFSSALVCDSIEAKFIRKDCDVDILVENRTKFDDGIVAFPTPGHTNGGCCFYYESPTGERYLFTGDLYYVEENGFSTFVYSPDGGSNEGLIQSLDELKRIEPTLVLSSYFGGESSALEVNKAFWISELDRNIHGLS